MSSHSPWQKDARVSILPTGDMTGVSALPPLAGHPSLDVGSNDPPGPVVLEKCSVGEPFSANLAPSGFAWQQTPVVSTFPQGGSPQESGLIDISPVGRQAEDAVPPIHGSKLPK